MGLKEFTGDLDQPVLKEFSGELDAPAAAAPKLKEFSGELDPPPRAAAPANGVLNTAGEIASDMGKMWGQGSGNTVGGIGRFIQAPVASAKELALGLWSAISDREDPRFAPRQSAAQQASEEAQSARDQNLNNGNAFSAAGKAMENVANDAKTYYRDVSPEMQRQQKEVADATGFIDKSKALLSNPRALAGTVVQSLPDTAIGMGVGRVAGALGKTQQASEALASTAGMATEATQSALSSQFALADKVASIPHADLYANNDYYRKLIDSGKGEQEAKAALGRALGAEAAVLSGLGTAAGSKIAGSWDALGKTLMRAGPTTLKQTAINTLKEGGEEAIQNPLEGFAQFSAEKQADPTAKYDAGGQIAEGLISGVAMGGPTHGAGHIQSRIDAPGRVLGKELEKAVQEADLENGSGRFDQAPPMQPPSPRYDRSSPAPGAPLAPTLAQVSQPTAQEDSHGTQAQGRRQEVLTEPAGSERMPAGMPMAAMQQGGMPSSPVSIDAGVWAQRGENATDRQYDLGIEKGQREKKSVGSLSEPEKISLTNSASQWGVDPKEAVAEARKIKTLYPASQGWAQPVVKGVKEKGSTLNDRIEFQQIPYSFHLPPGATRAPTNNSAWESEVAGRMTNEMVALTERAKKDPVARNIIDHMTWYREMARRLRQEFGGFGDVFADLLGATSPNTTVRTNWNFSVDILRRFVRGEFDSQLAALEQHLAAGGSADQFKKAGELITQITGKKYGMNSDKAMKALLGMWRSIKAGDAPKARNFALNLIGQSDKATIDVWAARMLQRLSGYPRIPPKAESSVSGSHLASDPSVVGGQFGFGQAVFEKVADALRSQGVDVTAPDLQAVAWFMEKEIWTRNGWTRGLGSEGSFENEADKMPVDRYQVGATIDQYETHPTSAEMTQASGDFTRSLSTDKNVVAYRSIPTTGMYAGSKEQSFDTEIVANAGWDPSALISDVAAAAKAKNQYDAFFSRVLAPNEPSANWRPGIEVYFKTEKDADFAEEMINQITKNGIDGFTLIKDPREARGMTGEDTGNYIGLRLQYVPEIFMRWADESDPAQKAELDILRSGDQNAINGLMHSKQELMDEAVRQVSAVAEIAYAGIAHYDTLVIGKENYDDYIGKPAAVDRSTRGAGGITGKSAAEVLQAAAVRLGIESKGRDQQAAVSDRSAGLPLQELNQRGAPVRTLEVRGQHYDLNAPNFGFSPAPETLPADSPLLTETDKLPKNHVRPNGQTTEQLHVSIVNQHFAGKKPVTGRKPKLVLMAGGGGAGKGYTKSIISKMGLLPEGAVDLDPDEIKVKMIPEFRHIAEAGDARGAAVTHEESSALSKLIFSRAVQGGFDIIFDRTMAELDKGLKIINDAVAAGYEVEMHAVLIDARMAAVQAMARAEETMRYVMPTAFLAAHKGIAAYLERYIDGGGLSQVTVWDNRGEPVPIADYDGKQYNITDPDAYSEIVDRGAHINVGATTLGEIYGKESASGDLEAYRAEASGYRGGLREDPAGSRSAREQDDGGRNRAGQEGKGARTVAWPRSETTSKPAKPGEKITVFRVSNQIGIEGANSANEVGLARFLQGADDFDSPLGSGVDDGTVVQAWSVTVPKSWSGYSLMNKGKTSGKAGGPGKQDKQGAIWYSMPAGTKADLLGTSTVGEIRKQMAESMGYESFDDAGWRAGGRAINNTFNAMGLPVSDLFQKGALSEDLQAQEQYLNEVADRAGYKSIDEMAEKDYPAFEKAASEWRSGHPAEELYQAGGGFAYAGMQVTDRKSGLTQQYAPKLSEQVMDRRNLQPLEAEQKQVIDSAIADITASGRVPMAWAKGVTYYGMKPMGAGFANYNPADSSVAVKFEYLNQAHRGDEGVARHVRGWVAHELHHFIDNYRNSSDRMFYLSSESPRMTMWLNAQKQFEGTGDLAAEAMNAWYSAGAVPDELVQFLSYPMIQAEIMAKSGHKEDAMAFAKVELFAQLGAMYAASPDAMEKHLPQWFAFFKEWNDARGDGSVERSRVTLRNLLQKSVSDRGDARSQRGAGIPAGSLAAGGAGSDVRTGRSGVGINGPAGGVGGASPVLPASGKATPGQEALKKLWGYQPGSRAPVPSDNHIPTHPNYTTFSDAKGLHSIYASMSRDFEKKIQEQRRGTIAIEQTYREAREMLSDEAGISQEKIDAMLGRKAGTAAGSAEILARMALLESAASDVDRLSRVIAGKGALQISEKDALEFAAALDRAAMAHATFLGARAEIGRAMRAIQQFQGMSYDTAEVTNILRTFSGKEGLAKVAEAIAAGAGAGAGGGRGMGRNNGALLDGVGSTGGRASAIGRLATAASKPTLLDAAIEAWKAGLLTAPPTHLANILGNTVFTGMRVPTQFIAGVVGALSMQHDRARMGEVLAMMIGGLHGTAQGLRAAFNTMLDEDATIGPTPTEERQHAISGQTFGATGKLGTLIDYVGKGVRTPFRALSSADSFFKVVNMYMTLYSEATRAALMEGGRYWKGGFMQRVAELINEGSHQMLDPQGVMGPQMISAKGKAIGDRAIQDGLKYTFQEKLGKVGSWIEGGRHAIPALHFIIPFVRTPTNIFRITLEHTPFAPLSKQFREEIKAGGSRMNIALAQVATGSMIGAAAYLAAAAGILTGGGDPEKEARKRRRELNIPDYSLKIGNKWYELRRLEPLGTLLGAAADAAEVARYMTKEENEHVAMMISFAFSNAVLNKTYMRGLNDLLNVLTDPERYGASWEQSMAGTVVPSAVAFMANEQDPYIRDAKVRGDMPAMEKFIQTVANGVKARLPKTDINPEFNRQSLPIAIDSWGQERKQDEKLFKGAPIKAMEESQDPVRQEAFRLRVKGADVPEKVRGVKTNAEQYQEMSKEGGQLAHDIMSSLAGSEAYGGLNDAQKVEVFNKVLHKARQYGRDIITPELIDKIVEKKMKKGGAEYERD